MTTGGRPLGVLGVEADFRPGVTVRADRRRDRTRPAAPARPSAVRTRRRSGDGCESDRWGRVDRQAEEPATAGPGARVVTVSDREGGLWSRHVAETADPTAHGLLVCASGHPPRRVLVPDETHDLSGWLAQPPPGAMVAHAIAGRDGRPGRKTPEIPTVMLTLTTVPDSDSVFKEAAFRMKMSHGNRYLGIEASQV